MVQEEIWKEHTSTWDVDTIVDAYTNPKLFQLDMRDVILGLDLPERAKVIEVGCEAGVSSYLLGNRFDRVLLDLNDDVIRLVKQAFSRMNEQAEFIIADMFKMPYDDEHFDCVFNAGVIEHFTFDERATLFAEYARVMKPTGKMVIAFPNHYSFPCRVGYVLLNSINKWPYPKEFKLYDLKESAAKAGLTVEKRHVLSRESFYRWLNSPLAKAGLKMYDGLVGLDGYLTVIVLSKTPQA